MVGRVTVFLAFAALAAAQPPPAKGRRIALVVANANYQRLPPLTSPVDESRLMADALRSTGFQVQTISDMRLRSFIVEDEQRFLASIQPGDAVVFYYSGYAVQGDDDNYLLPVDFDPKSTTDLEQRAYHLRRIQLGIEKRQAALKIFILESGRAINATVVGIGPPGLMDQPDPGRNSLFAFASSPGKTVSASDSSVGPFTAAVVESMKVPGRRVSEVFTDARIGVTGRTRNSQNPNVQDNIVDPNFFFTYPALSVSPASLTFSATADQPPQSQSLFITAGGYAGDFSVSVPGGAAWISATPAAAATPASSVLSVNPKGLAPGQYSTDIAVSARNSDMTSSPQLVHVSFTVSAAPKPASLGPKSNRKDREEYVYIPPGRFKMGCAPGDKLCKPDEKPQHEVTISNGFWMGRNEVEVDAWRRYVNDSGKKMKMPPAPLFPEDKNWRSGDHPIVNVSWENARDYCAWAGGRLPYEAEWEYAARAGAENEIYPLNDENSRDKANFAGTKGNDIYEFTAPVHKFDASKFGLYDMAGNVWEWVNDFYSSDYYEHSPAVNPKGPSDGNKHVRRGGSFDSDPREHLRISLRDPFNKAENNVGFRCVLEDTPDLGRILDLQ